MTSQTTPRTADRARLTTPLTAHRAPALARLLGCTVLALSLLASAAAAQIPTGMSQEDALRLLQTRPDLVRARLQQSGLSADEVRQRLASAGLQPSLLDSFLSESGAVGGTQVSGDILRALDILGVPATVPQGVVDLSSSTGTEVPPGRQGPPSRLYGLDVFRGRTTQFQPLLAGPVPETYRVGPGDVMVLVLTGDVELVHQLQVTREGFIVIPQVGQLFVSSVTMAQLRSLLEERLGRSYSGIRRGTTHFDVTIARLRTIQAFVIGEVAQPGAYQLASVGTVLNALYAAGGPTELGNFRRIEVQREGKVAATLDLYDYLLRGNAANDVMLQQGDVVFVPVHGSRVSINGAVVRPAVYELGQGETLADLVGMAGGLRPDALLRRLAIYRILPPVDQLPGPLPRAVVDVPLAVNGRTAGRQDGADTTAGRRDGRYGNWSPVVIPPLRLE
ncbi:MAG TPA: polysaccharide biosynthesis/export family protein, partial [Gemmatimonadales bacterium]|nr:polysaccharide biosynthesis/export family protein [Gemmatimonadales bacterium]